MIDHKLTSEILRYGVMAPSIDNCQPWRFVVKNGNVLDIFLDKHRAEFFGDYAYTASYATIGALVENITIAAAQMNTQAHVECFPVDGSDEPVARITFSSADIAPGPLFSAIEKRCTNRRPYLKKKIPSEVLQGLERTVSAPFRLILVEDPEDMKSLAKLSASIDKIIFEHRLLHENLFRWMRWDKEVWLKTGDGMGDAVLELPFIDRLLFRMISSWPLLNFLNNFGISRIIAAKNSGLLLKSSALGLLIMQGPADRALYFQGGRFLERLWLQATRDGLAFQPYGGLPFLLTRLKLAGGEGFSSEQVTSLDKVEKALQTLSGMQTEDTLLMLFRIGFAPPPTVRTPRRCLSDILSVKNYPDL